MARDASLYKLSAEHDAPELAQGAEIPARILGADQDVGTGTFGDRVGSKPVPGGPGPCVEGGAGGEPGVVQGLKFVDDAPVLDHTPRVRPGVDGDPASYASRIRSARRSQSPSMCAA